MKVSELWLRSLNNPKVSTTEWIEQLTQAGIEVDAVEAFPGATEKETDTVLTLKVPANRSDCLSMIGVAREWAAINHLPLVEPSLSPVFPTIKDIFPVTLKANEFCPRYVGRILQNINTEAQTPIWLKERLEKAGIRALSPVVDVTNYVMLELGQPMHAFDLANLDSEVIVRMASTKDTLVTLDSKEVTLDDTTLVIADKTKILAIAGIIGGESSAVSEKTKNIFLEAAYFNPISIRKTAQRLKLRTESSLRFERGIDPHLQMKAMDRATELLHQIVGGNVGPMIEQATIKYVPLALTLSLRSDRIHEILGITLKGHEVEDLLTRLGMSYITTKIGWDVLVPSFRPDITLEIDLIEELARLYGFQNIPEASLEITLQGSDIAETQVPLSKLKDILVSRGFCEAITYSFISPESHQWLNRREPALTLSNPISQDMAVMRESLLPGLLQALRYNQGRQQSRARLFETGTVFLQHNSDLQEHAMLGGLVSGTRFKEQWGEKTQNIDFFDIKNDIEALFALKSGNNQNILSFKTATHPLMHPGQTAEVMFDNLSLGHVGALHPKLLKPLELQGPVFLFEVSLKALQTVQCPGFSDMSKYPAIRRDIAVVVKANVLAAEIKSVIVDCAGPWLRDVWLFDVYQGKGIDPGSKSMALGLLLQHPSRTLVEEEVTTLMSNIVQQLAKQYNAILRE